MVAEVVSKPAMRKMRHCAMTCAGGNADPEHSLEPTGQWFWTQPPYVAQALVAEPSPCYIALTIFTSRPECTRLCKPCSGPLPHLHVREPVVLLRAPAALQQRRQEAAGADAAAHLRERGGV